MSWRAVLHSLRAPFLVLTPVCVFLGASTALASGGSVPPGIIGLALLGGMLAHISVNTLNEYLDFRSGLDFHTRRTPFSGGSGALPRHPEMAGAVLGVGVAALFATLLIGVFFARERGMEIVPVGLAGIALIVTYTGWLNRHPLLCLLAPGTGFGFLMVAGTHFVLGAGFTALAWLAAAVPFFLVNNLLLLNQYPDIDADRGAGRRHLPIAWGINAANGVYAAFLLAAATVIAGGVAGGWFPAASLVALLPLPLAIFALRGAVKYGKALGEHPRYLAANVAVTILVPLLLGLSILGV